MTRDAKCTFLEMFWKFWKDSGICSLFADSCCTSLISVQSDSLYNENAPPPIPTANDYKAKFMTVTQIRLEILKEKWFNVSCLHFLFQKEIYQERSFYEAEYIDYVYMDINSPILIQFRQYSD